MTRVCVTGIWHQGAVLAAGLASLGHEVRGYCSEEEAALLSAGSPLVHEPELPELLRAGVESGRLAFTSDLGEALAGADFVFISTDTPVGPDDAPDLGSVYELAERIAAARSSEPILCVSAQVPVGTTEELGRIVGCKAACVPEFLQLGTAVNSFLHADRFVVGASDERTADRVAALFEALGRPIVRTDVRSAELAKHAANAFLATSISFVNEISDLAGALGADALEVAAILKLDRRIGPHAYLAPGLGFAGGTLGRELRTLQRLGAEHDVPTRLVDAVVAVNDGRADALRRLLTVSLGPLRDRRIGVLGLAYKAGTSTLRRAVSLELVHDLLADGAAVAAFDPLVDLEAIELPAALERCTGPYDAARGADALLVLNELNGSGPDLPRLADVMRGDLVLDARGTLEPDAVRAAGLRYLSLWGTP
jgi:UDPglucose 6-dehydrogenase